MIVILIVGVMLSAVLSGAHGAVRVVPGAREDETLISGKPRIGGFVAPVVSLSTIAGEGAVLVGLRGGIIINRSFVLGLAGYGLASDVGVTWYDNRHLDFGYGGLFLEYVNRPHKLVHVSVHSLLGGGGLKYRHDRYDDAVFVFEPGLDVTLNITKHIRMGIGGSYRMVHDVDLDRLINNDISGPSASLIFKFGKF